MVDKLGIFYYMVFGLFIILLLFFLWQEYKKNKLLESGAMFFVLLGAVSNIIDRIQYGWVIDYIDLHVWPVFNIADIMIVGGVGLVVAVNVKIQNSNTKSNSND